jgi:hypothetical protein
MAVPYHQHVKMLTGSNVCVLLMTSSAYSPLETSGLNKKQDGIRCLYSTGFPVLLRLGHFVGDLHHERPILTKKSATFAMVQDDLGSGSQLGRVCQSSNAGSATF